MSWTVQYVKNGFSKIIARVPGKLLHILPMKIFQRTLVLGSLLGLSLVAIAADEKPSVASLGFLTGHWRGMSSTGQSAEEMVSSPEGGVMVSTGREFKDGKCVFYDLVVFAEQEGKLALVPHPGGRKSAHPFPIIEVDQGAKRAVFENRDHDFPKKFVYELIAPDRLRITLTGEIKGRTTTEVYDLSRVK